MNFSWIPYYKEFADKLLLFKNNRNSLLRLIYDNREELLARYFHDEKGENDLCDDIDSFSVFGLFNRKIRPENRIHSTDTFKKLLNIHSTIPNDFDGIPIMNIRSLISLDIDLTEKKMTYKIYGIYLIK